MSPPAPVTQAVPRVPWSGSGSINPPPGEPRISVDSPVAQERPVRAGDVHLGEINGHDEIFLFVFAGFGQDFARGAGHEALAPEFDPLAAGGPFEADAIGDGDIAAVGHRVAALNQFPGVVLVRTLLFFLPRMPADGRRIQQDIRAMQGRKSRGFGKPLVPANADADSGVARLPGAEAKVAGREIKFFVEQRVVRDVHLAIAAGQRTVRVNDRGRVMVNAGGALLEQGRDHDHSMFPGELLKRGGARTGNPFGEREIFVVFGLAEILRAKELLRADDLSAIFGSAFGGAQGFFQIVLGCGRATGLHHAEHDRAGGALHRSYCRGATLVVRSRRMMALGCDPVVAWAGAWPKSSRMNLPSVSLVGP